MWNRGWGELIQILIFIERVDSLEKEKGFGSRSNEMKTTGNSR